MPFPLRCIPGVAHSFCTNVKSSSSPAGRSSANTIGKQVAGQNSIRGYASRIPCPVVHPKCQSVHQLSAVHTAFVWGAAARCGGRAADTRAPQHAIPAPDRPLPSAFVHHRSFSVRPGTGAPCPGSSWVAPRPPAALPACSPSACSSSSRGSSDRGASRCQHSPTATQAEVREAPDTE